MAKIFITGITGLVGSGFCSDLLRQRDDIEFVAIARAKPANNLTAQQYVENSLKEQFEFDGCPDFFDQAMQKITVVEADITDPESLKRVGDFSQFDAVFHCAADVNLGKDPNKRTFNINFNGTKNVLELAKAANVKAFHYVSTAYTCGNHVGNTPEDDLVAEGFFNSYEESKFKAERMVRDSGLPFTIYRPSIIVGRQTDGRIRKPLAFYRLLYFFGIMKQRQCRKLGKNFSELIEFPLRVCAGLSDHIFLVPIDYVQDAITTIFQQPVKNKAYHLTGETVISTICIERAISEILGLEGFHLVDEIKDMSKFEQLFHNSINDLYPYFASTAVFDQTNISKEYSPIPKMDQAMLNMIVKTYYQEYFELDK